jgi:hypothetical protein
MSLVISINRGFLFLNNSRVLSSNSFLIARIGQQSLIVNHSTDSKDKNTEKKKERTPRGRFDDEFDEAPKSYSEQEPLEKHPGGVNPSTGEVGGPAGPEPTRFGDWERKGRISDF